MVSGTMKDSIERCNTCNLIFDEEVPRQALEDRKFAATTDTEGNVTQECCVNCAEELWQEVGPDIIC